MAGYFRGRIIRAASRWGQLPGRRRIRLDVVLHPGAVAVVAVPAPGEVLLLRQYRPVVRRTLWEIVAGTRERGESPLGTARRELEEETGHRARRWRHLISFYSAPGFCTEEIRVYLAWDLVPTGTSPDPDEHIRVVRMPLGRALDLARRGRIRDAKTIAGLFAADAVLRRRPR